MQSLGKETPKAIEGCHPRAAEKEDKRCRVSNGVPRNIK